MSYQDLRRAAEERERTRLAGRVRVVVQDSQCSRAVGSLEVLAALSEALASRSRRRSSRRPRPVEVAVAGCDGACFLAPRVAIEQPSGERTVLSRVTEAEARELAQALAAGWGPAAGSVEAEASFWEAAQKRRVLAACGLPGPASLDGSLARGGYGGLAAALGMSPQEVIERALAADVRGRGGAYFPAARKWQGARAVPREPRYIVVNAEEGEPGIFKDRHVLEGDPHLLLEGLLIAGYAAGASKGFIYVNAEADLSAQRVEEAIEQARQAGLIGDSVLASRHGFEVEVRRGAGGYVCGEETTLLNTIEGYRRAPRLRPPFPTEVGLFGKPTVINNVETLCNVALAFRLDAADAASSTKLVCLSGAVQRRGLLEVAMGTTLRRIVYEIGGGPLPGRRVVGVAAGGPSGGLLPESLLDTPIRPGALHESGAVLGSGGIVGRGDSVPIPHVVRRLAAYNAAESCGKCTPCREGTPRMVEALDRLQSGKGGPADLDELRYLTEVVSAASLCGLGQMAGGPITSGLSLFGSEFTRLLSRE